MHGQSTSRLLKQEVGLVLGMSLLPSAAYAFISLVERPVRGTTVSLVPAAMRWPDGARQLISIAVGVMPVLLIGYLLNHGGEQWSDIGVDRTQPSRDFLQGLAIAAIIGVCGLGLYVAAYHLGFSRAVVPVTDGGAWWQIPILLLSALRFGLLEETVVVGYLLRRLKQLGWGTWPATLATAILRGSYHLYQGYGAFVGNFVMGILFARWRVSGRRTVPLVIAHTLIDALTFVGWIALNHRLRWLPR
jgi:membrane protease YdiL (CAAX protease family)